MCTKVYRADDGTIHESAEDCARYLGHTIVYMISSMHGAKAVYDDYDKAKERLNGQDTLGRGFRGGITTWDATTGEQL